MRSEGIDLPPRFWVFLLTHTLAAASAGPVFGERLSFSRLNAMSLRRECVRCQIKVDNTEMFQIMTEVVDWRDVMGVDDFVLAETYGRLLKATPEHLEQARCRLIKVKINRLKKSRKQGMSRKSAQN